MTSLTTEKIDLNDIGAIKAGDPGKMLGALWNFPEQCEKALDIAQKAKIPTEYASVANILVTGLGGSAIGGDFLRVFAGSRVGIPIVVNRDYNLPKFVDEKTLLFAVSYSGNTEETLSAYSQALKKGAKIVALTNGGKLRQSAEKDGQPVIVVPAGISPRAATGYLFVPTLAVLGKLGLLEDMSNEIKEMITVIKNVREKMSPSVPVSENPAKQLAQKIFNKLPVIWAASSNTEVVATRWKGQINENGKAAAYWNVFPELNHNEIVGFDEPAGILKNLEIIILRDKYDHQRVKQRMDISTDIIKNTVSDITEVWSEGEGQLARMFSLTYIGDFVSVYLAALYGTDPTPVKNIDYLKNKLAES
ncbi:MAG TPA: bifunctional phosphoglucose/phosphomannose isomerase [Desulfobacteria bacterium]|nr:bifunctional phosphoglucose/phosphomannose isomerase [Desulfobacteria bacterium]